MKLFQHQEKFAADPPRRVILNWEMGTGKSMAVLAALDREKALGQRLKTLIVAPKSVLRSAWLRDAQNFPDLRVTVISGGDKRLRSTAIHSGLHDVLITNYEQFKIHYTDFVNCGIWRIVIDESSKIKACAANGGESEIAKAAIAFCDKRESVWLLSGTPAPNNEVEWFNQLRCVDAALSGKSSHVFGYTWCYPTKRQLRVGGQIRTIISGWTMRPDFREKFAEMLRKRVWTIKASECIDLPPETEIVHDITMTEAEREAYQSAITQLMVEVDQVEFKINPTAKTMKLRQITGGAVRLDGIVEKLNKGRGSKLTVLIDLLEQVGGKAVVWAEFTHEIEEIRDEVAKEGYEVRVIHGASSINDREEAIEGFQNGAIDIVVAHAAAAGHGITLTASRHNIFYSVGWVPENHEQARKRIHRIGQHWPVEHHYLIPTGSVDEKIVEVVKRKKSASEAIIELIRRNKP